MSPLLTLSYWFSSTPVPLQFWAERALLVAFVGLIIAGVLAWMLRLRGGMDKPSKKAVARIASHLVWTGVIGLCIWAMSYERIPWLSMRALYLLWGAWFLAGLWFIFRFVWWEIPAANTRRKEREEQRKWLPKRKK